MKGSHRIAISLLISITLSSLITISAYAGLFQLVEAKFFNNQVIRFYRNQGRNYTNGIDAFHDNNLLSYGTIFKETKVWRNYLSNQSLDVIKETKRCEQLIKDITGDYIGMRIIDSEGGIHFSSFELDKKRTTEYQIVYDNLQTVQNEITIDKIISGPSVFLIMDNDAGYFMYKVSIVDTAGIQRGYGLVYVSTSGASSYLVKNGLSDIGTSILILTTEGLLINKNLTSDPNVFSIISSMWDKRTPDESIVPVAVNGEREFQLYQNSSKYGYTVGMLISESSFKLNSGLKLLLIISICTSIFLLVFLLINLKQDDSVIFEARLKRFHESIFIEYLDSQRSVPLDKWFKELDSRKDQIKNKLLVDINKKNRADFDHQFDISWSQLVQGFQDQTKPQGLPDASKLEELLNKVLHNQLQNTPIQIQNAAYASVETEKTPTKGAPSATQMKNVNEQVTVFEEIDSVEAIDEVESVDEIESVDEMESVEEMESVDEVADSVDVADLESAEKIEAFQTSSGPSGINNLSTKQTSDSNQLESIHSVLPNRAAVSARLPKREYLSRSNITTEGNSIPVIEYHENEYELIRIGLESNGIDEPEMSPLGYSMMNPETIIDNDEVLDLTALFSDEDDLGDIGVFEDTVDDVDVITEVFDEVDGKQIYDEGEDVELLLLADEDEAEDSGQEALDISIIPLPVVSQENLEEIPKAKVTISDGPGVISVQELGRTESYKPLPRDFVYGLRGSQLKHPGYDDAFESRNSFAQLDALVSRLNENEYCEIYHLSEVIVNEDRKRMIQKSRNPSPSESGKEFDYEISELVDTILPHPQEEDLSIDSLLSTKSVDLTAGLDEEDDTESDTSYSHIGLDEKNYLRMRGFDFDAYSASFRQGSMSTIKGLMRLSSKFNAFYAAILRFADNGMRVTQSLGMDSLSINQLSFGDDEEGMNLFKNSLIIYLRSGKAGIPFFDSKLVGRDQSYLKGAIYFPIIFNNAAAYLYLGLKSTSLNIDEMISILSNA